jgi:hypothetical protein
MLNFFLLYKYATGEIGVVIPFKAKKGDSITY